MSWIAPEYGLLIDKDVTVDRALGPYTGPGESRFEALDTTAAGFATAGGTYHSLAWYVPRDEFVVLDRIQLIVSCAPATTLSQIQMLTYISGRGYNNTTKATVAQPDYSRNSDEITSPSGLSHNLTLGPINTDDGTIPQPIVPAGSIMTFSYRVDGATTVSLQRALLYYWRVPTSSGMLAKYAALGYTERDIAKLALAGAGMAAHLR